MFALTVRFDLRDTDAAAAFDDLVAQTLPMIIEHEPRTLVYATHTVVDEPLARVFYEVYADRDAHAEHEATAHTTRLLTGLQPLVTNVRVDLLDAPKGLTGRG